MNNIEFKRYFYVINYPEYEEGLCRMEMKYLFGKEDASKEFFSKVYISPSRSPFIKHCIKIIYIEDTLEEIVKKIKEDNMSFEDFKVNFIRLDKNEASYKERLESMRKIGMSIEGIPNIHNPKIILGLIKIYGKWIFGIYEKDDCKWHNHDKKPFSYSNALSTRMARAIVNIAVGQETDKKIIDPCCGVGTVVIEGKSMGLDIIGYEINPQIACNAKENMKALGYNVAIIKGNMHDIKEHFDIAIVDMPYGLFSKTTKEEQKEIIKTTRKISKKAVIITFENMDKMIKDSGFEIIDKSIILKNNFKRYINICK